MRPTLLKSFLFAVSFWLLVTTLWWSFQRPEVNLATLSRLKDLAPFLPFEVPATASILSSLSVQSLVFSYWSLPVLLLSFVSGLVGYGLLWTRAHGFSRQRDSREVGTGEFRGVSLTLGVLPEPTRYPCNTVDLGRDDTGMLSLMTGTERSLLEAILGTLDAHPDAYAGDGVDIPLLHHAALIAERALSEGRRPGLAAVMGCARELGKITAYTQNPDGTWSTRKNIDREAAKILATISAWYALPEIERNAVMLAVKYYSTPHALPEPAGSTEAYQLAQDLMTAQPSTPADSAYRAPVAVAAPAPAPTARPAPAPAPVQAPAQAPTPVPAARVPQAAARAPVAPVTLPAQAVVAAPVARPAPAPLVGMAPGGPQMSLADTVFDTFIEALPTLSFQSRGLPKGVSAIAWKMGSRVFMLEIKLRETLTPKLSLETRGALTPNPRERARLQPFTSELLKALSSRGWLVTTINETKTDPREALWNVKAGKLDFKGVIVIDVPPEYLAQLPAGDSMYGIEVTGPLFGNQAGPLMSKQDLMGSVLRPSTAPSV